MSEQNRRAEDKLTVIDILQSEAARYAALLVFFVPVAIFLFNIKTDIELIKQNHLTHIENIEEELSEQKGEIIEIKKDQIEIQKQILIILERLVDSDID